MKIFYIPSWYPNPQAPLWGTFIREQIQAISELCPDFVIGVSTWGTSPNFISLKKPISSIKKIIKYLLEKQKKTINRGIIEFYSPPLSWSERLPFGGLQRLIFLNKSNLLKFITEYGKPDLLHAHVSYPAGYIAAKLSEQFNIPYVLTEHMGPFPFKHLFKNGKPIDEIFYAFNSAAATIAVSNSLAEQIHSYGIPKPIVIPNFVDENIFKINNSYNPKKFTYLTLCHIDGLKGIDTLLKAISLWRPKDVDFIIGGSGPKIDEYKQLAMKLGISEKINWVGAIMRQDVPQYFQECSAFVMPSRYETFGIVYAEALASGKPVIATRCGGPEDIVNQDNGLLVDIDDSFALANAMKNLKENISKYDPYKIRADFENRFSKKAVVPKIIELYHKVRKY